jgi:hypothetical protein
MFRKITRALLGLLCLNLAVMAQDVQFNFDLGADFTKYKTYKWEKQPKSGCPLRPQWTSAVCPPAGPDSTQAEHQTVISAGLVLCAACVPLAQTPSTSDYAQLITATTQLPHDE